MNKKRALFIILALLLTATAVVFIVRIRHGNMESYQIQPGNYAHSDSRLSKIEDSLASIAKKVAWEKTTGGWAELRNSNYITAIIPDKEVVWFGTSGGVRFYRRNDHKWGLLTSRDGLPGPVVNDLAECGNWLWVATKDGLARINKQTLEVKKYEPSDSTPMGSIIDVEADSSGVWLLYGQLHGLSIRGRERTGSPIVLHVDIQNDRVMSYDLPAMEAAKIVIVEGNVWAIANGAIINIITATGEIRKINQDSIPELEGADLSSTSSASVNNGILYISFPSQGRGKSVLVSYDTKKGEWATVDDWYVSTMVSAGGFFWVGASYDILSSSEFVVKYIKDSETEWQDALYYQSGFLTSVAPDSPFVWIGTSTGILAMDLDKNTIKRFSFGPRIDSWDYLSNGFSNIYSIKKGLLLERYGDLSLFNPSTGSYESIAGFSYTAGAVIQDSVGYFSIAGNDYEGGPPQIIKVILDTLNRRQADITEGTDVSGIPYYRSGDWFYHIAGDKNGLWAGRGWLAHNYDADQDTVINGLFYYDFKTSMWNRETPDSVGLESDYITGLAGWGGTVIAATKEAVYKHSVRKWKKILDSSKIRLLRSSTGLFIEDGKMIQQYLPKSGIWQPVCSLSVIYSEPIAIEAVPDWGTLIGTTGGLKLLSNNGKVKQISQGRTGSITRYQGKWWAVISNEPYQIKMDGDSIGLEKPMVREECLREDFEFEEGTVPEI